MATITMTTKELQAGLTSSDHLKRKEVLQQFRDEPFGLEALPVTFGAW
jgi:hypothetical protein